MLAKGLLLGVQQALDHDTKVVLEASGDGKKSSGLAGLRPEVASVGLVVGMVPQ